MILQFPSEQGRPTPSLVWQAGNHRAEPVEPGTCKRQPLGCELRGPLSRAGLTLCRRQLPRFFVEPIAHGWLAKQLQELAHLRRRRSGINGLRARSGGKDRGDKKSEQAGADAHHNEPCALRCHDLRKARAARVGKPDDRQGLASQGCDRTAPAQKSLTRTSTFQQLREHASSR